MSTRVEWDPLQELMGVQKRMNKLFETALARTDFDAVDGVDGWTPTCDAYETDAGLVICLEVPGLDQEQIDIRLEGDELIVSGERSLAHENGGEQFHRVERSYGHFARRFRLPSTVRREGVSASFDNGVLRVELPREAGSSGETIRVSID